MNTKIWNLYKQSDEAKRLIDIFNPDTEDYYLGVQKVMEFSKELGDDKDVEDLLGAFSMIEANFLGQGYEFVEDSTREDFESYIDSFELRDFKCEENGNIVLAEGDRAVLVKSTDYRKKCSIVDSLSTFLYFNHSYFKPVLLGTKFNFIKKNCELLDIEFPAYPKAHDYKAALMWYYDLCGVFNEFQKANEMSDAEFCACLYGFGAFLREEDAKKAMPKPINVWITGASRGDCKELEKSMDNDSLWACNENTHRGDIVVLYALAPHSCIHSIWRADSEGVFNPFDYYQNRTRVSEGVRITPITLAEMKADPVFGKLPMLNNNLQGVKGKRLPSWAYSALLKMIETKGDDMSKIPVLYETKDWNPGEIKLEKDVEEKILIPVLKDLGYKEDDWTRQLKLKAGREEKAIPDFVFFPYGEKHAENAPLVIEAKKYMASERDRYDNYRQGRSYAKMLESEFLGLCDEERLIIYRRGKNGTFDYTSPEFEAHWAAIWGDEEVHDTLLHLIGADVIKRINSK